MRYYALAFFLIAVVAGVFSFGGFATSAVGISKILFVVFLLFVVSGVFGLLRRRRG